MSLVDKLSQRKIQYNTKYHWTIKSALRYSQ